MTAYRIPADAVLLTGATLDTVRYCLRIAQDHRRRNGLPPSVDLAALAAAVSPAVSPAGHADMPSDLVGQPDAMTTGEAADALGYSPRQVRRLAPALGGRLIGGRWLVDRQAVAEHVEGSTHP